MKALAVRLLRAVAGFCRRHGFILLIVAALIAGYHLGGVGKAPLQETVVRAPGEEKETQIWTCSMHPQIQRLEPGLCPICNMELIPLSAAHAGGLRELAVSEDAAKLMDIEVAPVERRFVSAEIRMVGKIDYDETNLSYITAWVPGRLDRLFVDYTGVTVQKGDHMVWMYSPELISAQEELLQALQAVKNIQGSDLAVMRRLTEETARAAREKLHLLGLTEDQIAEIERTGQVQDRMTIYAPTGGIVIHKNAFEGMYVQTGTRIYTIANLSTVWVKLDAYESDLSWLRYGQQVAFTTVSYPGDIFTGRISFIDPVLDEKTRTVKVRVNVPNSDGRLKPGMFVKAVVRSELTAGGRVMDAHMVGKWICPMHPEVVKDAPGQCDICGMPLVTTESLGYAGAARELEAGPLVIPASAPLITGTRAIVYVRRPDTETLTFEGREILLGPRAGDHYLVRNGLEEGELVVVKGNFKIDSSLQISAKPSMMTPEPGVSAPVHEHGGHMPPKEGAAPAVAALPPLAAHQLKNVMAAAAEVRQTLRGREPAEIRAAFGRLRATINGVDMTLMAGDVHALWMEYHMRLRNDAVEGMEAETLADMERVAGSLRKNVAAMANKFGLVQEHMEKPALLIPGVFRKQLGALFDAYMAMQIALTDDDATGARAAAEQVTARLKEIDAAVLTAELREEWTQTAQDTAKSLSDLGASDGLTKLRKDFEMLSRSMIEAARRFGATGDKPFYVTYCPMAFENRGASWLQIQTEIRNPYFGETMLQCGEVREVIGPRPIWKESAAHD